jgi:hypothetical protein
MPADRATTSRQVPDIPLHLLPKTIADLINSRRRRVYRITARMMFQNRFTLVVETRRRRYRRVLHGDPARKPGP